MAGFSYQLNAQTRCFSFKLTLGQTDWRDTMCVACTNNQQVINDVLQQLALPFSQRTKMIAGAIVAGDAGVNRNGSHQFKWHFAPNGWQLAENSMEVCDGRPWTDVDADTTYWLHTVGSFCPWTSLVWAEQQVTSIPSVPEGPELFSFYPNPAKDFIYFLPQQSFRGTLHIMDASGRILQTEEWQAQAGRIRVLELGNFPPGIYWFRLSTPGTGVYSARFVKH